MLSPAERSWSFLHLFDPLPGEVVISDRQIVCTLLLLRSYAARDECRCRTDEGNEPANQCLYCSVQTLIGEISGALNFKRSGLSDQHFQRTEPQLR